MADKEKKKKTKKKEEPAPPPAEEKPSTPTSTPKESGSSVFSVFSQKQVAKFKELRHALLTYGDKFIPKEVDDDYDNMYIDDKGFIDTQSLIAMLTGTEEEEEQF